MKQFVLACLTATSLTAAASMAPVCVAAESVPASVTGNWVVQITGDRFVAGSLHLTQAGDTVIGNAETADGSGVLQINGHFSGTTLSGKFREPNGNVGWITLNFNNAGTSLNGQWGWGGRKPNGVIVGKLRTPTSF